MLTELKGASLRQQSLPGLLPWFLPQVDRLQRLSLGCAKGHVDDLGHLNLIRII